MRLAMLLKTLNPQKKLKGILGSDKKLSEKLSWKKRPKNGCFLLFLLKLCSLTEDTRKDIKVNGSCYR